MAVYVDPSSPTNGVGTEVDPKNAPGNMTGDTYLFKRGTTYSPTGGGNALAVTGSNVTIGSYGAGDSPCVIDCREINRGLNVGTNLTDVIVQDDSIIIENVNAGTSRRGVTNAVTGSDGKVATRISLNGLIVRGVSSDGANDCNGISLVGAGNEIIGCLVEDIADDGVWARGNLRCWHTTVRTVEQAGRSTGDCIQLSSAAADDCNGFDIRHCTLDHYGVAAKQCFIINGTGGSGGVFAFNDVTGNDDALHTPVYIDWASVQVIGNIVRGGVVCVSMIGLTYSGSLVSGNVLLNTYGRGLDLTQDGTIAANNTVIGSGNAGPGIRHNNTGATGNQVRNNIVSGFATGIALTTGCDENYNCIYGATTSVSGATIGAQSITSDPLLDANYRPRAGSPCIGAGTFITGAKHYGGVVMNPNSPDIGAHRYFTARSTTERNLRLVAA